MRKIETKADELLELVHERDKITVSEAAKEVGIDRDKIFKWGQYLSDDSEISLHYEVFNIVLEV